MKKAFLFVLLFGTLLLSGCSGNSEIVADGNRVTIPDAGISFDFPENLSVTTGDSIYEALYSGMSFSGYASADELKKSMEEDGTRYLAQGTREDIMVIITAQDMTPEEDAEQVTLSDYARRVHDTSIFEYYASGYRTTDKTSLSEATYGGKSGWLSFFELTTAEDEPQYLSGNAEFMFEQGADIYSVQICFFESDDADEALKLFDNISAAD